MPAEALRDRPDGAVNGMTESDKDLNDSTQIDNDT